jgi:predicted CopG family antitoxin
MSEAIRSEPMGQTTISLDEDVADQLYDRKGRGESYNDVVVELLAIVERVESETSGDETHAERGDASADATDTMDTTRESETRSTGAHGAESEPSLSETIDAVADHVLTGSGTKLEARREALHVVVEYLREHGTATPSNFERDVYPDHSARYETPRSWWKNAMYPGLVELAERVDDVEKPDTSGEWTWIGGDRDDA